MQIVEVTNAFAYSTKGTGNVTLSVPGIGGAVDTQGTSIARWVGEFLRERAQADVLVTAAWIAPTSGTHGLYWNGVHWTTVNTSRTQTDHEL
ncbi:MAG TPA: hypothetical protein VES20_06270 [Bryobacteraceae bacterium]|nr:hypothetical protein [Bryobacteraceae bacterium]